MVLGKSLAIFVAALFSVAGHCTETLNAYNSYESVPFVTPNGGMAADVVTYLNTKLAGKYQFHLITLPRERLKDTIINKPNFNGIVLFLNPNFVDDASMSKYHWTPPLMSDVNLVISTNANKVNYENPDSLKGLRFGGILGARYAGLEDRFGKDIFRENVADETLNIKKLNIGRIDVTIMSASTYRYLVNQTTEGKVLSKNLYVSPKTHVAFERFFFSSNNNVALGNELDGVVSDMKDDSDWQAILTKYGFN